MSIKDNVGKTYHIPLSSPAKFGIFYNPCNNLQRAKMGYAFTTVSDIVDYDKPPYIIRATTKFIGAGPHNSIHVNEVLIIKTVGFGATRSDHYIKVYSLLSSEKLILVHRRYDSTSSIKDLMANCKLIFMIYTALAQLKTSWPITN